MNGANEPIVLPIKPSFDRDQAEKMLRRFFQPDDIIEFRALGAGVRRWWMVASRISWQPLERVIGKHDLYFGVNPRRIPNSGKSDNVALFRSLVLDLDNCTFEDAIEQLAASGLPAPTAIISSGGGIHLWWALEEPITDAGAWTKLQKQLIACFPSADKAIHDPPRIIRLPGSFNHKRQKHAFIIDLNDNTYKVSDIIGALPKQAESKSSATKTIDGAVKRRAALWLKKRPGASEGARNNQTYVTAAALVKDFALPESDALELLTDWNQCANTPPLPTQEVKAILVSAIEHARGEAGSKLKNQPPAKNSATTAQVSQEALQDLAENCALIIGTTQVWHNGLCQSMPLEALRAMYPAETKIWLNSTDRMMCTPSDIVFEPAGAPADKFNLWRGWPLTPDERDCPLIRTHLDLLAQSDPTLLHWLTSWLALPIQKPGAKLETALIIHGRPGTGKSLFFNCYRRIFGDYGIKITQNTIDSQYTGWLSRKLFIQCEEVGSTRYQTNKLRNLLKDWITGETVEIQEKYQIARSERAHFNFVFLSNEMVPLPVDYNDRRFTVVQHNTLPDKDYFDALAAEIADNGPARLMHYLLHYDIKNFNEHSLPPEREDREDLRMLCAPTPILFLREWQDGLIERLPYTSAANDDLYVAYTAWAKINNVKAESHIMFHRFAAEAGLTKKRDEKKRYYYVDGHCTEKFHEELKNYLGYVEDCLVK